MWEPIQKARLPVSAALQIVEVQRKLASFSEMERILRERSASREASGYLLETRRLLARVNSLEGHTLDIALHQSEQSSHMAA